MMISLSSNSACNNSSESEFDNSEGTSEDSSYPSSGSFSSSGGWFNAARRNALASTRAPSTSSLSVLRRFEPRCDVENGGLSCTKLSGEGEA